MKNLVWASTAIALAGCVAPQTDTFVSPSGAQAHATKCSQSTQACFKTATDTCKGAYQVLDNYSKSGGLIADALPGPVTWYYMTYQCGQSDGKFPQFTMRGPAPSMPQVSTTSCQRSGNIVNCQSF